MPSRALRAIDGIVFITHAGKVEPRNASGSPGTPRHYGAAPTAERPAKNVDRDLARCSGEPAGRAAANGYGALGFSTESGSTAERLQAPHSEADGMLQSPAKRRAVGRDVLMLRAAGSEGSASASAGTLVRFHESGAESRYFRPEERIARDLAAMDVTVAADPPGRRRVLRVRRPGCMTVYKPPLAIHAIETEEIGEWNGTTKEHFCDAGPKKAEVDAAEKAARIARTARASRAIEAARSLELRHADAGAVVLFAGAPSASGSVESGRADANPRGLPSPAERPSPHAPAFLFTAQRNEVRAAVPPPFVFGAAEHLAARPASTAPNAATGPFDPATAPLAMSRVRLAFRGDAHPAAAPPMPTPFGTNCSPLYPSFAQARPAFGFAPQ